MIYNFFSNLSEIQGTKGWNPRTAKIDGYTTETANEFNLQFEEILPRFGTGTENRDGIPEEDLVSYDISGHDDPPDYGDLFQLSYWRLRVGADDATANDYGEKTYSYETRAINTTRFYDSEGNLIAAISLPRGSGRGDAISYPPFYMRVFGEETKISPFLGIERGSARLTLEVQVTEDWIVFSCHAAIFPISARNAAHLVTLKVPNNGKGPVSKVGFRPAELRATTDYQHCRGRDYNPYMGVIISKNEVHESMWVQAPLRLADKQGWFIDKWNEDNPHQINIPFENHARFRPEPNHQVSRKHKLLAHKVQYVVASVGDLAGAVSINFEIDGIPVNTKTLAVAANGEFSGWTIYRHSGAEIAELSEKQYEIKIEVSL